MKDVMAEWEREKKYIPLFIKKYCHAKHNTKGEALCKECKKLTSYALLRLEMCPFKENKKFCSCCSVHCYKTDMREKMIDVMRWTGPRMIFRHPVYVCKHVIQVIGYKRKIKKERKKETNV